MLHVMQMVGGYSDENYAIVRAIERAKRCLNSTQAGRPSGDPTVVVAFQIAGPAFGPDFRGIRRDEFSKRDRMVAFDVAVPTSLPPHSEVAFIWAAFVQAVDMAEEFFRGRKLDWPVEQLRESLQQLRECLQVPSPELPLSHWLSPGEKPAQPETMLSVQLPTTGAAPTPADVERRQALEQRLDDALSREGSGHLDGGDIGRGVMGVYVSVVAQPAATETVLNVLRQTGDLEAAFVVVRHSDPDVAEEEQYEVIWPQGYTGPALPEDLYAGIVNQP